MNKTLNTYNINIKNLNHKQVLLLKNLLNKLKIPAKIQIVDKKSNLKKYEVYASSFK